MMKYTVAHHKLDELAECLKGYRMDIGRYPTANEGLRALVVRPPALPKWIGSYLPARTTLLDPWGREYIYHCENSCQEFFLESLGADGREGGGESDADIVRRGPAQEHKD